MNNYINNLIISSIGATDKNIPVLVQFYGRPDLISYPATLIDLLKHDKHVRDIIDSRTGEILFTHDL